MEETEIDSPNGHARKGVFGALITIVAIATLVTFFGAQSRTLRHVRDRADPATSTALFLSGRLIRISAAHPAHVLTLRHGW